MNYDINCSPFCVIAEHSTYFTAFVSFASFSPCSCVIGFCEDGSSLVDQRIASFDCFHCLSDALINNFLI